MREEAVAVRLVEGRVIVTRFDFAPGAETGRHRHGDDCVITAITDSQMGWGNRRARGSGAGRQRLSPRCRGGA